MPNSLTMPRAMRLACSRSLVAPLEISRIHQFLGQGAAQGDLDLALQLRLRDEIAILFGPAQHVAQSADAARDDGDFVDRRRVRQGARHQAWPAS